MTAFDSPRLDAQNVKPTVAAGFASALLAFAVAKGANGNELLERTGIAADRLREQGARLPLSQWIELMRAAKGSSGDPALALHFGEAFDASRLSVIGLVSLSAETYPEDLENLNRFWQVIADVETGGDPRFQLVRGSEGMWLFDTRLNPDQSTEISEVTFAQIAAMVRGMLPHIQYFRAVYFTHSEPPHRSEYDRVFKVPLMFGSDRNGMLLPEEWDAEPAVIPPRRQS